MAETFNSVDTKLTTTGLTTVYQAPNLADTDRAVVLSCLVCNVGTPSYVTIIKTTSADVELARWTNNLLIPAESSLEVIQNKKVLKRGQKIKVQSTVANSLDITVDTLELL